MHERTRASTDAGRQGRKQTSAHASGRAKFLSGDLFFPGGGAQIFIDFLIKNWIKPLKSMEKQIKTFENSEPNKDIANYSLGP